MKRPLLALVGAAMLVSMLPAVASADRITKFDEHRVSASCDSAFDGGFAEIFAKLSSDYQLQAAEYGVEPCPTSTRVSTSGPSSVIAIVCSTCALGCPSMVTTVQPSDKTLVKCVPLLTIGSTAKT